MYRAALPFAVLLAVAGGCHQPAPQPAPEPPSPADVRPTNIDYVDTDAFDELFQSALVNQDPVIVIHTGRSKPDWDGRLNAWIAAWNRGGPAGAGPRTARGQIPIPGLKLDEGTLREFRLLVNGLMDRVEVLARDGRTWWTEERVRSQRIALLKPYDLRFHLGADGTIDLVFFNGSYSSYYPDFVKSLTGGATAEADEADEPLEWMRTFRCSRCRALRDKAAAGEATLTGRGGAE
jgi:hypothetical protein